MFKRIYLSAIAVALLGSSSFGAETRFITGDPADATVKKLYGPALNLGGGSDDVDEAMQWMIDQARGCTDCGTKIDVVVLRSSGADGYNEYIYKMRGVDSVETLLIKQRDDSVNPKVIETVRNAEVVFFAGGDQCNYVKFFKDTEIERAIENLYRCGGSIGGTSAGLAIQGSIIFDACPGPSTKSSEALQNPYHESISFTYNFFNWKHLNSVITDTHFAQRDRMGRLMAYLARQIKDGKAETALGLAVNEKTSVVLDKKGAAKVMGTGPAYLVLADHEPEDCAPGQPLTFSNYKIWKFEQGKTFSLKKRPKTGYYTVSVNKGVLSGNPYRSDVQPIL
jgi:cyanophycinase